jgi:ribosomal protein L34E
VGRVGSSLDTDTYPPTKKLWAKALLPIGRVTMAKKKVKPGFAICGQCAQPIDLEKLYAAQKADRPYVHYCGRVLNWGGTAEVLTSDLDDPDPSNTSESNR